VRQLRIHVRAHADPPVHGLQIQCGVNFFMFGTCFGPSTQGAGIRHKNTSQIQILLARHFEKKRGRDVRL
jgi:hypothetical protein